METPIWDFARRYAESGEARFHMPGHKGKQLLGPEALDLTEIRGADELYRPEGIIRRSEEQAAALFGAGKTLYSTEGSSLCIRAMLYLACLRAKEEGLPLRLLAARNAHKALMYAAALLGAEIDWLEAEEGPESPESFLTCRVSPRAAGRALAERRYMGVWLTSPDYTGVTQEIGGIAKVCRKYGVPLLVDNAHGAYLRFLERDTHPLTLGADLCCDSAHKTLDCLTGAAYLHLSREAAARAGEQAEAAMALFGSTSPSYLILASLDRMNGELAGDWPQRLRETVARLEGLKGGLRGRGWGLIGGEPMKLTLRAGSYGYTGDELHDFLRRYGIEGEYSDPELVTLMPSPRTDEASWSRLERALGEIPRRAEIRPAPPKPGKPERVCSIREAMLSPRETIPAGESDGRVLADACVGCPPAVPILMAGERITAAAIVCFRHYGIQWLTVMKE